MKKICTFLVMLAIIGWSNGVSSQTLDQSQLVYNGGTSARTLPGYSHFQSFTAGITGTLVEIDMGVFNTINGVGVLKIYAGQDTTGTLLQTTPVTVNCPSGACFTNFTTNVAITSGNVYSFRFIPGTGIPDPYGVQIEAPGTYTGGQFEIIDPSGVYTTGFDQVFRTYVTTTTGIKPIETNYPGSKIYQNTMDGSITVSYHSSSPNSFLRIMDMDGKTVYSQNLSGTDGKEIIHPNLTDGVYFWDMNNQRGKLVIMK